jgi:hypothetical protein
MTLLRQVAFNATCSHLFTVRHGEFTYRNDTVTASDLVGCPLSIVTASALNRPPISAKKTKLNSVFLRNQGVRRIKSHEC